MSEQDLSITELKRTEPNKEYIRDLGMAIFDMHNNNGVTNEETIIGLMMALAYLTGEAGVEEVSMLSNKDEELKFTKTENVTKEELMERLEKTEMKSKQTHEPTGKMDA